jgi:hypothetical protein
VIKIFRDKDKKIAVIEARRWDKDYVYVYNAYIHPDFRHIKFLKFIISETYKDVVRELGNFKYVYFKRKKYKDRLSKSYPITYLLKGVPDVQ